MNPLFSQLEHLIAADAERMRILRLVRELDLPDGWVAAGFVRSAVWDHLHRRDHSPLPADIDVIWFDAGGASAERDAALEASLRRLDGSLAWSVKNQARMHQRNDDPPYRSATDAMRHWPETATAVAARLGANGIEIAAPLGLEDLFDLRVRPTLRFQTEKLHLYRERLHSKNWSSTWPDLIIQQGG
ncbi:MULTISPECIES: nucleotidyltransferase family protein [unclassified Pseudomonas]|uniref:nucleotidyltransferase family protein n=1 Tax=unclassified Pseudomonas TaxID=196821 RepID=UPI00244C72E9|nr:MULTISPECIES: nucleotidyltransferase family protein [unclassified Pseudomonas]MDH0892974.1 nucleotidyltransferase family protein [Pseudomonas sp. GD03875]MDH1067214.1 nucleotidyltransferase family protein [Pseudomonas sp. GD03985]